jgi:hypothetical protein
MTQTKSEQFDALSDFLGAPRKMILQAWRIAADADPTARFTGRISWSS